jgi:hypothetical protein
VTIKSTEFRLTAQGWPGIFISEEEAALALAGRPLPDRILQDRRVSDNVREMLKGEENRQLREETLGNISRIEIARWPNKDEKGFPVQDTAVKVEVWRSIVPMTDGRKRYIFKSSVSGRSYSIADTSLLIDALQIAWNLMSIAEAHVTNQKYSTEEK